MGFFLEETYPRLFGDIGGTNARFALQQAPDRPLSEPVVLACRGFAGLAEAIRHFLASNHLPHPRWAALGIATPISGDVVAMTNHSWSFSIKQLQRDLSLSHLRVMNDFTALAMSLPVLAPHDLVKIGSGTAVSGKAIALLGAGTGLGVSGLIPAAEGFIPIEGEGGHVTLPAFDVREQELIDMVRQRFPHISAERLLSGPGLSILHEAVVARRKSASASLTPAEITSRGIAGTCSLCREALDLFCALLGTVAADLALVLGARGGVYIGGGIVPQLGSYFATSPFRARFEEKGRFSDYLVAIPTWVIHAPWPGILGAARALDDDARRLMVGESAQTKGLEVSITANQG
jgi:glucokinase